MHNRCMCTHNIFKAEKDIAAGQEIFVSYGGPLWFEAKSLPHTDVDYASTRWRPDLQPLPCRKTIIQTTGVDGRRSYTVFEAVQSGAVLEISLCLKMPVVVIDQFPYLWDFVLTRETENVHAGWQWTGASSRAHAACVFAGQGEGKIPAHAEWVRYFISPVTLFECPNP